MFSKRTDAQRLRCIMPSVNHSDSKFCRFNGSPVRPFSYNKSVDSLLCRLFQRLGRCSPTRANGPGMRSLHRVAAEDRISTVFARKCLSPLEDLRRTYVVTTSHSDRAAVEFSEFTVRRQAQHAT